MSFPSSILKNHDSNSHILILWFDWFIELLSILLWRLKFWITVLTLFFFFGILMQMDGFVLPSFEFTCILKDKDIVWWVYAIFGFFFQFSVFTHILCCCCQYSFCLQCYNACVFVVVWKEKEVYQLMINLQCCGPRHVRIRLLSFRNFSQLRAFKRRSLGQKKPCPKRMMMTSLKMQFMWNLNRMGMLSSRKEKLQRSSRALGLFFPQIFNC